MANEQHTSNRPQGEKAQDDGLMASARAMASDAMGKASETVSSVASEGGTRLTEMVDQQIRTASRYVSLLSDTARSGATNLDQEAPQLARMLRSAADRTDELAHMLEDKSYSDMVDMAGRYIRSNPRVFLGGAVAVGFVVARLLKDLSPGPNTNSGYRSQQGNGMRSSSRNRHTSQNYGSSGERGYRQGEQGQSGGYGSWESPARGAGQDMTGSEWGSSQQAKPSQGASSTSSPSSSSSSTSSSSTSSTQTSPSQAGAGAIRRGTSVTGEA